MQCEEYDSTWPYQFILDTMIVHDCRKNHNASSKAMEPVSAVEMFNNAPKQKVKYAFYTGDDDSTTEAHIPQKVSYGVEKFSDIIHMKRSLTT